MCGGLLPAIKGVKDMPDIYEESTEGWVEEVYPDWTILKVLEFGIVLAFNRETGRVYPLPSDECPFILTRPLKE